jgi:hypothetical protein
MKPEYVGVWVSRVPGAVPIGEVVPDAFVRVAGAVRVIRVPSDGVHIVDVLIADATGEIWFACDFEPDRFIIGTASVVEGSAAVSSEGLRLLQPRLVEAALQPVG